MSEFENTLKEIGSFGKYQVRQFVIISMFEAPIAWYMFLSHFTHSVPEWICLDESLHSTDLQNYTESNSTNKCPVGGCRNISFKNEFTSIVSEWQLVCERDIVSNLINSLLMFGVLVGAFVTGQLADMFGRKLVFYIVYFCLCLSALITSFSTSWHFYATLRFLTGAFIGGSLVINVALPLEFVTKGWRTFCMYTSQFRALVLSVFVFRCIGFWAVGVMLLGPIAYLVRDWRQLTLVTALLGFPILCTYKLVSESPRWLMQKGRFDEAEDILNRIAEFNNKPKPSYDKLRAAVKAENEAELSKRISYWDLFRTISMTKNTLILCYAWLVSSCVYYGTTLNLKNLGGNKYMHVFLSGLVEIPVLILVVLVSRRVGRRWTLFFLMFVAGASNFAILFVDLSGRGDFSIVTQSLALLGRAGIAGGWAATGVFSAEMFPTVVRNIGIGSCSVAARIGGIIAPQFVYLAKVRLGLPFALFGGVALLCAVLVLFLPETRRKSLPDALPAWGWPCCHRNEDLEMEDMAGYRIRRTSKVHSEALLQNSGPVSAVVINKRAS